MSLEGRGWCFFLWITLEGHGAPAIPILSEEGILDHVYCYFSNFRRNRVTAHRLRNLGLQEDPKAFRTSPHPSPYLMP